MILAAHWWWWIYQIVPSHSFSWLALFHSDHGHVDRKDGLVFIRYGRIGLFNQVVLQFSFEFFQRVDSYIDWILDSMRPWNLYKSLFLNIVELNARIIRSLFAFKCMCSKMIKNKTTPWKLKENIRQRFFNNRSCIVTFILINTNLCVRIKIELNVDGTMFFILLNCSPFHLCSSLNCVCVCVFSRTKDSRLIFVIESNKTTSNCKQYF